MHERLGLRSDLEGSTLQQLDHVSRPAMLGALAANPALQHLLPYARQFHPEPSSYTWYDDAGVEVLQAEGGEQGDPILPFVFPSPRLKLCCGSARLLLRWPMTSMCSMPVGVLPLWHGAQLAAMRHFVSTVTCSGEPQTRADVGLEIPEVGGRFRAGATTFPRLLARHCAWQPNTPGQRYWPLPQIEHTPAPCPSCRSPARAAARMSGRNPMSSLPLGAPGACQLPPAQVGGCPNCHIFLFSKRADGSSQN